MQKLGAVYFIWSLLPLARPFQLLVRIIHSGKTSPHTPEPSLWATKVVVSLHWGQTSKKQGSPLPPSVVLCLGQAAPHRNYFSPCAENTLACFPPQCRRVESEPGRAHRSGLVVSSRGCKNRHRQLGQVRPSPGDAL